MRDFADGTDPSALCRHWAAEFSVGAVTICMWQDIRLPLGASDHQADLAESLQDTLGDGPCLTRPTGHTMTIATAERLRSRWPVFASELHARTAFRSVGIVPVHIDATLFGSLDLYSADPHADALVELSRISVEILLEVSGRVRRLLDDICTDLPSWLISEATVTRTSVWSAVDLVQSITGSWTDALALLRGYAWSHGCSVDAVATDVITGRLEPAEVVGRSGD